MVCDTNTYFRSERCETRETTETSEPSLNRLSKSDSKNYTQIKGLVMNEKQIDFLRNKPYLYNCYVRSILENLFLQRFWFRLSHYVPIWIAPCTLTCIGLLINVMTSAILIFYSPDAKQSVPPWPFLFCAIGIFVYQIFDALDGKQAVKVQDTPIEEVYDHGCDAVSALFVTQSVTIATCLGDYPLMQFVFFLLPLLAFYLTHYSCHVTRVMHFGRVDVIEGQWAMILIHLLTFLYGQQIWSTKVLMEFTVTHILFTLTLLALIMSMKTNINLIFGAESPMDRFIRIPRKIDLAKWNPFCSMLILTILAIIGYKNNVFHRNPLIFIFMFGLSFAKLSFKLQIMNVTHENMPKLDTSILGPISLIVNSYLNLITWNASLAVTTIFALLDYSYFFCAASIDMKRALDLNIFSLKYPVGHKKCRNKNYGFNLNGTENATALHNIDKYSKLLSSVYD